MKKNRILIASLLLLLLQSAVWAQADIQESVISAIRQGSGERIAQYFNDNVELSIQGTSNVFSKQQSQTILNDFFSKNRPRSFEVIHNGSKGSSQFTIGNMTTSGETFRVYFLTKSDGSQQLIYQFRIENNE